MKAAIIGLGAMGKVHLDTVCSISDFDSVVACDISKDNLNLLKEKYFQVTFYEDHKLLFEKEKPDYVSVVTLGSSHLAIVKDAVQSGVKYILCEKPISTNLVDAEEIVSLSKNNDVKIAINHSRRGMEFYQSVKDKFLPEIGGVKSFFFSCGGGRLGSVGVHLFDMFRYLSDKEFTSAYGVLDLNYSGDHKGRDVFDPGASVLYMMEDNIRCYMDVTDDIGTGVFLVISGPYGRIVVNEGANYAFMECRSKEDKEKRLGQYTLPLIKTNLDYISLDLRNATKEMIESLIKGDILCSTNDGLKAVEPVLAMHLCSKDKKVVTFPLKEKDFNVNIT